MTITIGMRREGFVLLASDRLSCSLVDGRSIRRRIVKKIVVHPTLPLAFAVNGLIAMGNHGLSPMFYLEYVTQEIQSHGDLTLEAVADRVSGCLDPRFRQTIDALTTAGRRTVYDQARVNIGLVGPRGPEFGVLELGKWLEAESVSKKATVGAPDHVLDFYASWPGGWNAEHINGSDDLAEHAETLVRSGIEEDMRHGAESILCGGGVDIVLLDAHRTHYRRGPPTDEWRQKPLATDESE